MRKTFIVIFAVVMPLLSCSVGSPDPYGPSLRNLSVTARYPEPFTPREGADVRVEDTNLGTTYQTRTDATGAVSLRLPIGVYRVSVSDRGEEDIFNGSADKVRVLDDMTVGIALKHSKPGTVVFKEIYCGGCMKAPLEGTYNYDKYIILHNNDVKVQYLDGLCFGSLHPFNSTGTNPWVTRDPVTSELVFPDFVPVAQCVWQFPGSGNDFPLNPGEDAVVSVYGAIDHSATYPLSVNLNRPGCFVCYNATHFPNPTYHPAPGDKISQDRILKVVIKTGQASAYTFSNTSPAAVLFRAPEGTDLTAWCNENKIDTPGDSHNPVVPVPDTWVIDAVEVFDGSSSSNSKRFSPTLDAGYASLGGTHLGHTLMRRKDEVLSVSSGFEVLCDTNNSTEDFYEREKQSLHE